jgi:hypothetical protein
MKWKQESEHGLPINHIQSLSCATCVLPIIKVLLSILCTLPVTTRDPSAVSKEIHYDKISERLIMLGFFLKLTSHDNVNLDMSGVIDEFAHRHHKESKHFIRL